MRNAAPLFAAAAAFALLSTGCSSFVPFTYELRAGHRLTDGEVKDLQFYSSHEITLRREVHDAQKEHKARLWLCSSWSLCRSVQSESAIGNQRPANVDGEPLRPVVGRPRGRRNRHGIPIAHGRVVR